MPASIADVAFSPDGKVLTAEDTAGVVYLWDPVSRQLTFTIGAPADPYSYGLVISPDSQTLATLQNSGARDQVYLWNIATNRSFVIVTNPGDSPVSSVAFSPDGKTIAISGLNGKTALLDIATQKLLATFTNAGSSGVTTAAFSPDGQTLAAGDYNGKTYLWNLRTGTLVATLRRSRRNARSGVQGERPRRGHRPLVQPGRQDTGRQRHQRQRLPVAHPLTRSSFLVCLGSHHTRRAV